MKFVNKAQKAELINMRYFYLVLILPHELNVITHDVKAELYRSLFQAVSQILDKFAHNRKRLKGQLGITMAVDAW
jgi:hypothetical protein